MWNPRHRWLLTYYFISTATDVCHCTMTERVCCPYSSGLTALLHRRKGYWESGVTLCLFPAVTGLTFSIPVPLSRTLWSFAMKPVFLMITLWRPVEKSWQGAQIPVLDRAPGWEAGMLASTFWEFIKHLASFFLFIVLWFPLSLLVGHVCSLLKFLVWLPCNLNNLWWAQETWGVSGYLAFSSFRVSAMFFFFFLVFSFLSWNRNLKVMFRVNLY